MPTFPLAHGRFASLRFAFLFFSLIGAGALTPAAHAQVTYAGTAAAQNFGSQAVSVTSAAVSFPFSVAAGTTVGSVAVLTQGSPNLDFASVSGTTCAAQNYPSASACVVNVVFTPKFAGYRMGAVVFFSEAGNTGTVLGKLLVAGTGVGAQIAYGPGTATEIVPVADGLGLANPVGVAVDGAGDLFIADAPSNRIVEVPAGGVAVAIDPEVNGQAVAGPQGVSVDGAGDLFIADGPNNRVVEVPIGDGAAVAIDPVVDGTGLNLPAAAVVDGVGDLFISDARNYRVVEVPAGGGAATAIAPTVDGHGLNAPEGLAVDGAGNLFIADFSNDRVVEVPTGGGAAVAIDPVVGGLSLKWASGVAVDGTGDLFIADGGNNRVVEVPAGGGAAVAIDPTVDGLGLMQPDAVAVDSGGGLFALDPQRRRVVDLQHSQAPALNFPTATAVGSTDSTDGTQTVQITNIGNEPLTFSALAYPADFSEASGDSAACTGSTVLSAEESCDLPVQFTPRNAGQPLNEAVTLTDNAPAGSGHQSIAVSGTGTAVMTSPTPGSAFSSSTVTFSWTPIPVNGEYALRIGTGLGGNNLYQSSTTTATSLTVTGLPTLAQKVYVRLDAKINGVWQSQDYIYYEVGTPVQAQLTSPAAGSYLSPDETFTWSAGTGVSAYFFQLGTHGPGTYDVFNTGATTALSATGPFLQSGGGTIYARLGSKINGSWQSEDYTFPVYTIAELTAPTSSSPLSGSTVTFDWTAGHGVSEYALRIGTGQGANNIYQSPNLTGTSLTVTGIPTTGATIWVRLNSKVNGEWLYQDYTYTEQ